MKMSDRELDIHMKKAKHSLAVEGLEVTEEIEALVRKNIKGQITDHQFRQRAIEMAKEKGV